MSISIWLTHEDFAFPTSNSESPDNWRGILEPIDSGSAGSVPDDGDRSANVVLGTMTDSAVVRK